MFLHLSISFSLSAKQADLKIILLIRFFKKLKNNDFSIRKQKLARVTRLSEPARVGGLVFPI